MGDKIHIYQDSVIKILVLDYFPVAEGWLVERYTATGNNNTKLDGIMIRRNKIEHLVPLEDIKLYYDAGYNEKATAQKIWVAYVKNTQERKAFQSLEKEYFYKFENVKDKICYKVVNAKANNNIDAPFIVLNKDLMLTFFIHYQFNKDMFEVINIDNSFIKKWGLEDAESILYRLAEENTKRIYPVRMMPVLEYFKECFPEEVYKSLKEKGVEEGQDQVYILTNLYGVNGAGVLAYGKGATLCECKKQIEAETGYQIKGMFILPMSVKEVFIIPDTGKKSIDDILEIIATANEAETDAVDFLSDNVFYFDEGNGFIQLTFINREICR